MTLPKSNAANSLLMVCLCVLHGIAYSAIGNYLASLWAFIASALFILITKDEEIILDGLKLARESNDGWREALERNRELLEKMK